MIASLIVAEIVSKENKPLSKLLNEFRKYSTLEETNFKVEDKNKKLKEIEDYYKKKKPKKIIKIDGISIEFDDFWLNVRPSNTEPLLRVNMEAKSKEILEEKKGELIKLIETK